MVSLNNKLLHIINLVIQKWMLVCKWSLVLFHFSIISRNYTPPCHRSGGRELRKDPIVVSSTSGRHLKLYDLALLEIDLNWVDWVRAIKKAKGTNFCGQSVFYQGYVPIYAANCIAISPYHQCLKFTTPISSIFIFASPLPPLQHSTDQAPASEKKPTFFYGTLQFTHEHLVVKICCSKEMLFLFVLSRKNLVFFVSNANYQGEFLEYFFQQYFNFLGVLEQITPSYVPNYPQKNIHYVCAKFSNLNEYRTFLDKQFW